MVEVVEKRPDLLCIVVPGGHVHEDLPCTALGDQQAEGREQGRGVVNERDDQLVEPLSDVDGLSPLHEDGVGL